MPARSNWRRCRGSAISWWLPPGKEGWASPLPRSTWRWRCKRGARVALLDADIYGPSIPTMTGTLKERPVSFDGKLMEPVMACGIKTTASVIWWPSRMPPSGAVPWRARHSGRSCTRPAGARWTTWWWTCPGHRRYPADAGPAGAHHGGGDRHDAPGCGAGRCPQRGLPCSTRSMCLCLASSGT